MQEFEYSNLLPSLIWWLLAASFLVLWRIKITSWHCGVGFALTGTGFALDAFSAWGNLNVFFSGLCYIAAASLYSGCILHHFEVNRRSSTRVLLPFFYLLLHAFFVFGLESLRADLFLTDAVFACLFFHALFLTSRMAVSAADRFMLVSGSLLSVDCVVRAVLFTFVFSSTDQLAEFANSNYSVAVQITTMTIGLLFPVSVLAAIAVRAIESHRNASEIDPMTGLLNRRGFFRLVHEIRAKGAGSGALRLADIDHFKRVNDHFGHKTGDFVIKGLSAELERCLGGTAIIARFGGEEFVAYLPDAAATDALMAANSINHEFGARYWGEKDGALRVTVSIGVTNVDALEPDVEAAVDRADKALYAAKDAGRNRVIVNTDQFRRSTGRDEELPLPDKFMPDFMRS